MNRAHFSAVVMAAALCGCTAMDGARSGAAPRTLEAFGDAVREARSRQVIDPHAGVGQLPVVGIDGQAAVSAWRRYQDSFREPPPAFEVMGIGGAAAR